MGCPEIYDPGAILKVDFDQKEGKTVKNGLTDGKRPLVFYLKCAGDLSVGIFPAEDKVTIETTWRMDKEDIQALKDCLREFFDADACQTEEEHQAELKAEAEIFKHMEREVQR